MFAGKRLPQVSRSATPQVSILMTMLNEQQFVGEALESIAAQQGNIAWELAVVDDGSSDNSYAIACAFATQHANRVTVLRHPGGVTRGTSASRNLAMAHTRAPLVSFLDADDVWLPHRLSHHQQLMSAHPQAAMVYGQTERWFCPAEPYRELPVQSWAEAGDGTANFMPPLLAPHLHFGVLPAGEPLASFLHDQSLTPCTCSVTVRRSALEQVGGFVERFDGLYDDQALYARLALQTCILADPCCVARYRRHAGSCCDVDAATADAARQTFLAWLAEFSQSLQPEPESALA